MGRTWRDAPLRWRLTAFYVALLVAILATLGVLLYAQLASFLWRDARVRLLADAAPAIARHLGKPPGPKGSAAGDPLAREARPLANELSTRDLAAVVLGRDGTVLASGQTLPDGQTLPEQLAPPAPTPDQLRRALAGETVVTEARDAAGRHLLVCLVPLPADAAPVGVVQLAASLAPADDLLARLRLALALGLVAAVALGTLGGVPLTRAALRPLARMTATSERIATGDLGARAALPRRGDEIGRLAAAFDRMVDRLEGALRAQRQLVADASHELRTPLTALGGSVELLLLGVDDEDAAARQGTLRAMHREIERLARLVGDLLTLSRLDARPALRRRAVDLAALVAEVAAQTRLLAGDRIVTCRADGPLVVAADPDRLRQVLLNLAANAVAFTAPDGRIALDLARVGGEVRVAVADDGAGIDPADLPHLFDRFYRGDKARARRPGGGGSGLGLAIARTIVEAHGGTLAARSTPGRGATFTVTLPAPASVSPAPQDATAPGGGRSGGAGGATGRDHATPDRS